MDTDQGERVHSWFPFGAFRPADPAWRRPASAQPAQAEEPLRRLIAGHDQFHLGAFG
jgi:hypothetical protein